MRAGRIYRCPVCARQSPHPVPCHVCDAPVVDEHGNPPPALFERESLFVGVDTAVSVTNTTTGGAEGIVAPIAVAYHVIAYPFRKARWRRSERQRLRAHQATMQRAPRTAIGQATAPWARVAGRVEVLEPAIAARPSVAFVLERLLERGNNFSRTVETRLTCGRFLLHDDSGSALIDDDFVAILPLEGQDLPATANAHIEVHDGHHAEICGPAERRIVPDLARPGAHQNYRQETTLLCFDGTPSSLLVMRPLLSPP